MDGIWKAALGILGTVAPGLATAIGGPLGGVAMGVIAEALGLPADSPPQQVAGAVERASPEVLLKLKEAEQAFATRMKELGVDLERIAAGDRSDARARQIALRDRTPAFIGAGVLLVWAGVQAWVMSQGLAPGLSEAVATRVLGMLDAAALGVIYYFFGSSNQQSEPKRA